ncbi:MAG: hypothetical protein HYY77_05295 [Betaproteobacteria bacterium]|nr:hypothetical protein [Betaproteobacteria bacterium]
MSADLTPYLNEEQFLFRKMRLSVKMSSAFKSMQELIAYAKANPGKLADGPSGVGSLYYSTMLLVNKVAGIDTFHISTKASWTF